MKREELKKIEVMVERDEKSRVIEYWSVETKKL